jgi:hypothetical protein
MVGFRLPGTLEESYFAVRRSLKSFGMNVGLTFVSS